MTRGELSRHKQPTDIERRTSLSDVPVVPILVFGTVTVVALAVVALTAAVVAVSIAVVAVALRPYFKR